MPSAATDLTNNAQGALLNRELKVTNAALFSEHRKQFSALHKSSYFISVVKAPIKEIHGNSDAEHLTASNKRSTLVSPASKSVTRPC